VDDDNVPSSTPTRPYILPCEHETAAGVNQHALSSAGDRIGVSRVAAGVEGANSEASVRASLDRTGNQFEVPATTLTFAPICVG
jgi:hypothetical protein